MSFLPKRETIIFEYFFLEKQSYYNLFQILKKKETLNIKNTHACGQMYLMWELLIPAKASAHPCLVENYENHPINDCFKF